MKPKARARHYNRRLSDEPDPTRMLPISTGVSKPQNDDPSIIEPVELSAAEPRCFVMSPSAEDKLLSLLVEIRSDIRQIKSDLQTLLKQQQRPTPASSSSSDDAANSIESAQSGSPEDVLRYLRETRGEDDTG